MDLPIEWRDPASLRNHPLNQAIFGELQGDADAVEFAASVAEHGVLQPLLILDCGTILSGHRRRQAAVRAGLDTVPVVVRHDLQGLSADLAWFSSNQQRVMTTEQRARWYAQREAIEAAAAKERQRAAGGQPAPAAAAPTEQAKNPAKKRLGEISPKRSPRAADLAAAEVDMDRRTATKAKAVVEAIDAAVAAGDTTRATALRTALEKSVSAAHRIATAAPPPAPPLPAETPPLLDSLRRPVPAHLVAAASSAAAFSTLARKLDGLRREFEALAAADGGQHALLSDTQAQFRALKKQIADSGYMTTCPRCTGEGCAWCKHGFLPLWMRGMLSQDDRAALGIDS